MSTATTMLGPWDGSVFQQLKEWDPEWAETCFKMSTSPWNSKILSPKLVELIGVGLNAACTNLNADGTRRHIRAALEVGASRDEILLVLKCATVMSIYSCTLGTSILFEEASEGSLDAAGDSREKQLKDSGGATPFVDKMKAFRQWDQDWDPLFDIAPAWTDEFMATAISIYDRGILPPKDIELMSIAFGASFTHMCMPGIRRHIKHALRAGATVDEIMEVLKLCVVQGVQACNLGVPILEEELASRGKR